MSMMTTTMMMMMMMTCTHVTEIVRRILCLLHYKQFNPAALSVSDLNVRLTEGKMNVANDDRYH